MFNYKVLILIVVLLGWNSASSYGQSKPGSLTIQAQLEQDPLVVKAKTALLCFQRRNWEQGIALQAALEMGDTNLLLALARASAVHSDPDGRVASVGGQFTDSAWCGEGMWEAARISRDPVLRKAADGLLDFVLHKAPRAPDGCIYSSQDGGITCDSIHAFAPFLAAAARYDEAMLQLATMRRRFWDPEKKLMKAQWSEKKQTITLTNYWGGASGWTASALMRVIRSLPDNRAGDKQQLQSWLQACVDGCLALQRADGLFPGHLADTNSFREGNLANMLAYTIYESVRGGWLPKDKYLPAADRMRAAVRGTVDRYGFLVDVAGAHNFQMTGSSPEAQAFFVLMETAARRAGRPLPPQPVKLEE